jgi:hypothetical protein
VKYIYIYILFIGISTKAIAQVGQLPAMQIETQNAQNKISWNSQYDGIKSIAIQRSNDSTKNFAMIGVVNNPKKGLGSYIDEHPNVGKNYYRLSIEFAGDVNWSSNVYKVELDSATIAKSLGSKLNISSTNAKVNAQANSKETVFENKEFYFTPSTNVYTNSYTGHVTISLADAQTKRYHIRFLDPNKMEVLKISRIMKSTLILDRSNFNNKGTYQFELYNGQDLVETGFVTIY